MAKKYKINKMTLSKYKIKYKTNKNIIFYPDFINHKYLQTKKKLLSEEYLLISPNFNYNLYYIIHIY